MKFLIFILLTLIVSVIAVSQEFQPIKLLPPQTEKGKTLMKAAEERRTTREYSDRAMSLRDISSEL